MSSLSSVPQLGFSGVSFPGGNSVPGMPTAPPGPQQGSDPSDKRSQSAPQSNNPSIQRALRMHESIGGAPLVTTTAAHGSMPYEANEEPGLAAQTSGSNTNIGLIVILSTLGINVALLGGFASMLLIEAKRNWARNPVDIEGTGAHAKMRAVNAELGAAAAEEEHRRARTAEIARSYDPIAKKYRTVGSSHTEHVQHDNVPIHIEK